MNFKGGIFRKKAKLEVDHPCAGVEEKEREPFIFMCLVKGSNPKCLVSPKKNPFKRGISEYKWIMNNISWPTSTRRQTLPHRVLTRSWEDSHPNPKSNWEMSVFSITHHSKTWGHNKSRLQTYNSLENQWVTYLPFFMILPQNFKWNCTFSWVSFPIFLLFHRRSLFFLLLVSSSLSSQSAQI